MASFKKIDLIVQDVAGAVAFFRDVVGLVVLQEFPRFAELEGDGVRILLSPDALVPIDDAAGVILHFETEDVAAAANRAALHGARILKERFRTDWGTESIFIQGPEGIVIDFYRDV